MASEAKKMKAQAEDDSGTGELEESRDYDKETQKALEEIDLCQNEIDALNEKSSEEILKVEQKYNQLRKPFFDKRSELIKSIPNFWVTAFVNHQLVSTIIDEDEEECLHYLEKVEVEEFDDIKSGFKIMFHFRENPFFENDVLVKEINMSYPNEGFQKSTPIKWKEGHDLLKKCKGKNSAKGRKRSFVQTTFFSWFTNEKANQCGEEISEAIKDELWVNPLQYYLSSDVDGENGVEGEDDDGIDEGEDSVEVLEEGFEEEEEEDGEEALMDEEEEDDGAEEPQEEDIPDD